MENFDPEMMFPHSEEKIKLRNEIINKSILSSGIEKDDNIVHFGCGSRGLSFINFVQSLPIKYTGVDIDPLVISSCQELMSSKTMVLKQMTMQQFMDDNIESQITYDWCIIDGLLDKNLYGDSQYEFVDTILRRSLVMSERGMIVVMDSYQTKHDDSYNSDFIMAYIGSMYNRFSLNRLNERFYILTIYKYYD